MPSHGSEQRGGGGGRYPGFVTSRPVITFQQQQVSSASSNCRVQWPQICSVSNKKKICRGATKGRSLIGDPFAVTTGLLVLTTGRPTEWALLKKKKKPKKQAMTLVYKLMSFFCMSINLKIQTQTHISLIPFFVLSFKLGLPLESVCSVVFFPSFDICFGP